MKISNRYILISCLLTAMNNGRSKISRQQFERYRSEYLDRYWAENVEVVGSSSFEGLVDDYPSYFYMAGPNLAIDDWTSESDLENLLSQMRKQYNISNKFNIEEEDFELSNSLVEGGRGSRH